ncbi:hypothetical protein LOAG_14280, partial [Loa loa]
MIDRKLQRKIQVLLSTPLRKQKRVLLLCEGIRVFNPEKLELQVEALALFDVGMDSTFISRKLANHLGHVKIDEDNYNMRSFGNKESK